MPFLDSEGKSFFMMPKSMIISYNPPIYFYKENKTVIIKILA